jgi:hypothetical protein
MNTDMYRLHRKLIAESKVLMSLKPKLTIGRDPGTVIAAFHT